MEKTVSTTVFISLNGAAVSVPSGTTLGGFLDQRDIVRRMVAVEYNGEILPRWNWDDTNLSDGDVLEVVQAVGGG